jgi:hypothetical protein
MLKKEFKLMLMKVYRSLLAEKAEFEGNLKKPNAIAWHFENRLP